MVVPRAEREWHVQLGLALLTVRGCGGRLMSIYFRDTCTCSGPVPGWNQHEAWCGTREDRGGPYNRWSHPDANLPTETPKGAA
ncbi:hypothetical protein HG717_16495 [Rhodococcus erythropolis]|uniref:hypothetical protein n=1 Tax=Rhodococcus erythropolis TaxID=1833 RepID=UPI001C9B0B9E|nr:hypothetical protein [Rhodococcus erythropolis]MBY6385499.1 hypothetical protein [Rhodococcus erythropolis]